MNIEQGISNDEMNSQSQNKMEIVDKGLNECNELIAIFNKSIETAKKNNDRK